MKFRTIYKCTECEYQSVKWMGQCPECSAWNSLQEDVIKEETKIGKKKIVRSFTELSGEVTNLKEATSEKVEKIKTNISEFDRLLSGGLIAGQTSLLAGAPGIGKSTLMMQVAGEMAKKYKVLYVSGEESLSQISTRAKRLGIDSENILVLPEINLEKVIEKIKSVQPKFVILDSIQTIYHPEFNSSAGSILQIKESAAEIIKLCKSENIILFILGHITKEGALAGPKILEHMVDTVLYFDTEKDSILKILRAYKNRFGATDEVGLFKMGEKGLESIKDVGLYSLQTSRKKPIIGRAFSLFLEGTRPLVAEIQALVSRTVYPFPKRVVSGLDLNRCQILLASMEKNLGISFADKDVFISIAGGIKSKDTALDLAICASVISSYNEKEISHKDIFVAEVGILGQMSGVKMMAERTKEAKRMGFGRIFCQNTLTSSKADGILVEKVENLYQLSSKLK